MRPRATISKRSAPLEPRASWFSVGSPLMMYFAAARRFGGVDGAGAVALFADHEEEAEVAFAIGEQFFGGKEHGGDDAFGIARAAAPDFRRPRAKG
jgi:hypothetical protein